MLYIGIDVAKRSHVAAAMNDGEGIVVEPFEFRNTRKGLERLLHTLAKRGVSPEGSLVGMEATGHYWVALFDFLTANGFEAAVINPIQTDAWRKVDTARPAKTDGIDALLIADLLRCKRFEPALAALIAGEIGDARRFETPSKLVAYAGMDATRRGRARASTAPGTSPSADRRTSGGRSCRGRNAHAASIRTSATTMRARCPRGNTTMSHSARWPASSPASASPS